MKSKKILRRFRTAAFCFVFPLMAFVPTGAQAETGAEAWLRYAPLEKLAAQMYSDLPASVVVLGDSPLLNSAKRELLRGVSGMLGRNLREAKGLPQERDRKSV